MRELLDKCVVAGSFDPVTNGHMHLIGVAAMTFKSVIVAIGVNDQKKCAFTTAERLEMLKRACAKYSTVTVTSYDGLTADFMRDNGAKYLVRGVRNEADLKYEEKVFKEISSKNQDVELTLIECPKEYKKVSSTLIRGLMKEGKPYEKYLPYEVIELVKEYSKSKKL